MRKPITLAAAAALILTCVSPAWSADRVTGTSAPSGGSKTPAYHRRSGPQSPRQWVAPPNSLIIVTARYCEDKTCEPVTLRIWSGDTFVMDRLGPHEERIRIANIDAPDVVPRCPTEAALAQEAKNQLRSILSGSTFALARVSGEKDRASFAFVNVNGRDVGKKMMDQRHARPLERPARPWC